ncbi:MAG: hypothetical protein IKV57_03970, partial [Clostridia bacterium]|nr:hypothetical protein [Clostridia bacterium]
LGMNTDLLPELGENPAEVLSEITALSDTRQTFTYTPAENCRVRFCCNTVLDRADVTVNGKNAGVLLYKPYQLDITDLLTEGENTVTWTVTGSAANTYGKPVPTGVTGARVEITEIR